MFSRNVFTALLALSAPLAALADVTPSEPGPGDVFNAGQPCNIVWSGDAPDSGVSWKDMNIELMTGDNLNMIHITTVAKGQDGSVDGKFSYTCPQVKPNSAIYFYQFTAAGAPNATWTTRFTIASETGATTPPANANQPGTTNGIAWGVGALVDPSQAVPAPVRGAPVPAASGTGAGTPAPIASVPAASGTPTPAPAPPATLIGSSTRLVTSASTPASSASGSSAGAPAPTSGAGMLGVDARVSVGLGAVAFVAALLL